jgi:uncharacterized protein
MPLLDLLTQSGLAALAIDPWGFGERDHDHSRPRFQHVFGNFRRCMWPILGQTGLDLSRAIDWSQQQFGIGLPVVLSGLSMGGDIAITAAGIDQRVAGVFAVGSTPDWLRPGMADDMDPPQLMPPGEADLYAQFFYDSLDPMTHTERYLRDVRLHLVCGERDTHIHAEASLRFKAQVTKASPEAGERFTVDVLAGVNHSGITDLGNWRAAMARLLREIDILPSLPVA